MGWPEETNGWGNGRGSISILGEAWQLVTPLDAVLSCGVSPTVDPNTLLTLLNSLHSIALKKFEVISIFERILNSEAELSSIWLQLVLFES